MKIVGGLGRENGNEKKAFLIQSQKAKLFVKILFKKNENKKRNEFLSCDLICLSLAPHGNTP